MKGQHNDSLKILELDINLYDLTTITNGLLTIINVNFAKIIINANLNVIKCFNINE
jgi:hypothetical protein